MLAFQVEIDGAKPIIAGRTDLSVLSVTLSALLNDSEPNELPIIHVGGLTQHDEDGVAYHLRWGRYHLELGSELKVRVLDIETVDEPSRSYRSDHEIQESAFTPEEMEQMEYEEFLRLKEKFEPIS